MTRGPCMAGGCAWWGATALAEGCVWQELAYAWQGGIPTMAVNVMHRQDRMCTPWWGDGGCAMAVGMHGGKIVHGLS